MIDDKDMITKEVQTSPEMDQAGTSFSFTLIEGESTDTDPMKLSELKELVLGMGEDEFLIQIILTGEGVS